MKGIMILALLFAAGCSSFVPLEQLEAEALVTGDWSRVEQRERALARRNQREALSCPDGTIAFCEVRMADKRCGCVDEGVISAFMGR